jgi:hypothetical protein
VDQWYKPCPIMAADNYMYKEAAAAATSNSSASASTGTNSTTGGGQAGSDVLWMAAPTNHTIVRVDTGAGGAWGWPRA